MGTDLETIETIRVLVVSSEKSSKENQEPTIKFFKVLDDPILNDAISAFPNNNFEIHKTIWRVPELKAKRIVLQLPEGFFLNNNYCSSLL